jgi:hypothetical protein
MSDTASKTKRSTRAARGPYGQVGKIVDELDDRLGIAKGGRIFLDKIFPDHWSFMLGEIALYSFVVIIATGIFLSLYFVPSATQVLYHGSYAPLRGQRVSEAYQSTVNISFSVRGGLLIRQMHHWAADIFVGSIVVHMARIFFTGAFRKPREANWTIGLVLLILGILNGFIGYSLRALPLDELDGFVDGWATNLAGGPPLALSMTKTLLHASSLASMEQAVEDEARCQALNFSTQDTQEAMAAFAEKREPVFIGR